MTELILSIPFIAILIGIIWYYFLYGEELYCLNDNLETVQKELNDLHNTQLNSFLNNIICGPTSTELKMKNMVAQRMGGTVGQEMDDALWDIFNDKEDLAICSKLLWQ